jgi:hypothetical protein
MYSHEGLFQKKWVNDCGCYYCEAVNVNRQIDDNGWMTIQDILMEQ